MSSHQHNMVAWKVCIMIAHFLALTLTLVRLYHHWKTRQLWWDDYLVVAPWFFDLLGVILFWLQYDSNTILWESAQYNSFFFSWWFICFVAFAVIWQSRISMSFSIARIFTQGHPYRKVSLSFATLLCFFHIASLVLVSTMCRGSPWYNFKMKTCMGGDSGTIGFVPALLFAFDVISDLCLVAFPLRMLWKIKLPRSERALILSLFSSSALTLLATILYCGLFDFLWHQGPDSRLIFTSLGHLQASFSLLAANLLVVTMLIYKTIRCRSAPRQYPIAQPKSVKAEVARPEEINQDHSPVPNRPPTVTHVTLTIVSDEVCFHDPSLISYDRNTIPLPSRKSSWDGRLVVSLP